MEPFDQPTLIHEITEDESVKPPTLADQLRERRTEIAESKTVMLPLTGYEKYGVQVQHRLVDRTEVEDIGRRILNETRDRGERNMRILLDTIITSTVGFYHQIEVEEPTEILNDLDGDARVTNWGQFAQYLGWRVAGEDSYARAAVYWVFGGNEFAIGQYGIMLNRWMGNTGIKVDEEFLGEIL
jgi:hypothetical protein